MCKRYFFILFVLKICTFRFANYKTDGFKIVRHGNNTLYLNCRHCVPDSVINLSYHSVYPSFYLLV